MRPIILQISLALLCVLSFGSHAFSQTSGTGNEMGRFRNFVEIEPGRSIFADYILPAAGQPTIILVNGLTYRTGDDCCWGKFARALASKGYGVLMFDFVGQGQNLLRDGPPLQIVPKESQARDMTLLLQKFGLTQNLNIFALSYGTEIASIFAAAHPDRIHKLILASAPDGPIPAQDNWIRQQVAMARIMNPFISPDDYYLYYLRVLVASTFPTAEPIVLENPYKLEAVYRLTAGVITYKFTNYSSRFAPGTVVDLQAGNDMYIDAQSYENVWNGLPVSARAARIILDRVGHKSPEEQPLFTAEITHRIIQNDPRFEQGREYVAYANTGALKEIAPNGNFQTAADFNTIIDLNHRCQSLFSF